MSKEETLQKSFKITVEEYLGPVQSKTGRYHGKYGNTKCLTVKTNESSAILIETIAEALASVPQNSKDCKDNGYRKGLILLLTELADFAEQMKKETNMGRVYVSTEDSKDILSVAVKSQSQTIELLTKGIDKIKLQLREIITELSKDVGKVGGKA